METQRIWRNAEGRLEDFKGELENHKREYREPLRNGEHGETRGEF